jgi:hypothetical protein
MIQGIEDGFGDFAVGVGYRNDITGQIIFSFGTLAITVDNRRFAVHSVVFVLRGVAVGIGGIFTIKVESGLKNHCFIWPNDSNDAAPCVGSIL